MLRWEKLGQIVHQSGLSRFFGIYTMNLSQFPTHLFNP
jgi:hypothetical protein